MEPERLEVRRAEEMSHLTERPNLRELARSPIPVRHAYIEAERKARLWDELKAELEKGAATPGGWMRHVLQIMEMMEEEA